MSYQTFSADCPKCSIGSINWADGILNSLMSGSCMMCGTQVAVLSDGRITEVKRSPHNVLVRGPRWDRAVLRR
jgi:hypothetical protein